MSSLSNSSRIRSADTIVSRWCMDTTARASASSGTSVVAGDEARGAQHPQRVVAEALRGGEGRAQPPGGQIGRSAERIDEHGRIAAEIEGHGVDGEVAP